MAQTPNQAAAKAKDLEAIGGAGSSGRHKIGVFDAQLRAQTVDPGIRA